MTVIFYRPFVDAQWTPMAYQPVLRRTAQGPDESMARLRTSSLFPFWTEDPRKLRILIVDDEPDIRASLQEALRNHVDAEVLVAADGLEGQRVLQAGRCDIVLLDHMMPGLDGGDLLAWMTKHRMIARTVIITALPDAVLAAPPLLLRGAAAVMRKPLDLGELLATIRSLSPSTPMRLTREAAESGRM